MEKQQQSFDKQISRRKFIGVAGGITFLVSASMIVPKIIPGKKEDYPEEELNYDEQEISVWVHIREDGQVRIYNPSSEMGQGSMTALPVIFAEEMDADWSKVHIEQSPADPDIYGIGWGGRGRGSMITVGSRTVTSYYNHMRQAGAQARYILLASVAEKWTVPITELSTEPGVVIHKKNDRRISYGEIASFAQPMSDVPEIPEDQLKDPKDFRLIGKMGHRFDIPAKVDGTARYAIDVQVPGMLYGVISRSPVHGSKPTLLNEEAIRNTEGIIEIVALDHGIGIIADSLEGALQTKEKLQIQWSKGARAESHTSEEDYLQYEREASGTSKGNVITSEGNIDKALQNGAKTFSIDYKNDHVYHAQMEPLNAVVSVAEDGSSAEAWVGTQAPGSARRAVADVLGIDAGKVDFHRLYLGGGFGRRSNADYVREATMLAKAVRRPVKLMWTREDDLQYGMFRPMSLQRMQASVDKSGNITGWSHIIVGTGSRLLASGATTEYYTFPNQHLEVRNIDHGIRTKHWRAVGHGPNKFAIEAFIDEIASDQGVDPFEFRMQLMKNFPRAQEVLKTAAEMADWGGAIPEGRARGIAFAERSRSLAACVCEISVDRDSGKIKVHHIWASLDGGVIVQPDNAIAQMEGGLIMGLSSIMTERISFKKGMVQQSNFHDYPILRMADIPETIEVKLIPSTVHPTGIGESGVPIIGGAVANAFGSLTGKRLRHMPFTQEKVRAVLNS